VLGVINTITQLKYRIFGISLIAFLVFWAFLWLGPKEGISPLVLNGRNIDSIRIFNSEKDFTITSVSDIDSITKLLKRAIRLEHIEGININSDFYDLSFSVTGGNKPIFMRIMNNKYNGMILRVNDYTYNGSELDSFIKSLRN
jgi:hypothetical protein